MRHFGGANNEFGGANNAIVGERDRYWTCVYIGPPRFLCLAMRCRLVWPTGAYTAEPLVDWRSVNGGQYAQAKTVGIFRFVTSLFYFYPDFKWVPASNYRYCIN